MHEVLTIGEETSETSEYLFGNNIRQVQPITGGKILIADASDNSIRIFNEQGQFLHKFGRRGRGPGEFSEISSIEVTQDNRIVILDRYQNRVTIFNQEGGLLNSSKLSERYLTNVQFVFERRGHDSFFVGYRDFLREPDEGHYLHLFEEGFESEVSSHLSVFDHFFDSTLNEEMQLSSIPLYLASRFGSHQIGVVPSIYTGTIATLNEINLSEKLFGQPLSELYQLYNWNDRGKHLDSDEKGFMTVSGQRGKYLFKSNGSNFGLVGNKNFLLQFFVLYQGNSLNPYITVYSSSGEFLQTLPLETSPYPFIKNERVRSIRPMHLDTENKLYIVDNYYEDTYPAVRVFKTNLHELLDHE